MIFLASFYAALAQLVFWGGFSAEGPHKTVRLFVGVCVSLSLSISVWVWAGSRWCVSRVAGVLGGQMSDVQDQSGSRGVVRSACEIGDDACWRSCLLKSIPAFFFLFCCVAHTHTETHTCIVRYMLQLRSCPGGRVSVTWADQLSQDKSN